MAQGNQEQHVDATEVSDNEISEALPPALERITVVPKGTDTSPAPSTHTSSYSVGRHGVVEVIGIENGADGDAVRQFEETQQAKKGKFAYLKSRQFWYCKNPCYRSFPHSNVLTGLCYCSPRPSPSARLEQIHSLL